MKSILCRATIAISFLLALVACQSKPSQTAQAQAAGEPLRTVSSIDLQQFAGSWHVIAHIPGLTDRNAIAATEVYTLDATGGIGIEYSFTPNQRATEPRVLRGSATVRNVLTFAEWLVRWDHAWPVQEQYLVLYVQDGYQIAVVGSSNRRNLRILSRTPTIDAQTYSNLILFVQERCFDVSTIRRVPQS